MAMGPYISGFGFRIKVFTESYWQVFSRLETLLEEKVFKNDARLTRTLELAWTDRQNTGTLDLSYFSSQQLLHLRKSLVENSKMDSTNFITFQGDKFELQFYDLEARKKSLPDNFLESDLTNLIEAIDNKLDNDRNAYTQLSSREKIIFLLKNHILEVALKECGSLHSSTFFIWSNKFKNKEISIYLQDLSDDCLVGQGYSGYS